MSGHDGHDSGGHAVSHKMLIGTCLALLLPDGRDRMGLETRFQ